MTHLRSEAELIQALMLMLLVKGQTRVLQVADVPAITERITALHYPDQLSFIGTPRLVKSTSSVTFA